MNTPTFLNPRRRPKDAPPIETGVRDILSSLKASADFDTCRVLASATNTYTEAILRLRSDGVWTAQDISNLVTIWEILLDVGRPVQPTVEEFAPKPKPEPEQPNE